MSCQFRNRSRRIWIFMSDSRRNVPAIDFIPAGRKSLRREGSAGKIPPRRRSEAISACSSPSARTVTLRMAQCRLDIVSPELLASGTTANPNTKPANPIPIWPPPKPSPIPCTNQIVAAVPGQSCIHSLKICYTFPSVVSGAFSHSFFGHRLAIRRRTA